MSEPSDRAPRLDDEQTRRVAGLFALVILLVALAVARKALVAEPTAPPPIGPCPAGTFRTADGAVTCSPTPTPLPPAEALLFGTKLDLNTATAGELAGARGIGPALAARIVARRAELGRFRSAEEVGRVPGIGPKKLAALLEIAEVRTATAWAQPSTGTER